jgi:CarD family transcriptional regulator
MYAVGDLVLYRNAGVCRVEAVGAAPLSGDATKEYYTLSRVYKDERVYLPRDAHAALRPIMSRGEALSLIERIPFVDAPIYEERQASATKQHYENLLRSHDRVDLVRVIKSVDAKRRSLGDKGKTLGLVEQQYSRQAEERFYDELALALEIPRSDIQGYVEGVVAEFTGRRPQRAGAD